MQVAIFYISENDVEAMEQCNKFLSAHRIVSIQEQFVPGTPSKWTILIKHTSEHDARAPIQDRKDYREILSESDFARFARFRSIRKTMSEELLLPAYVIFTNEELAQMARLGEVNLNTLKEVHGIGQKKVDKFGKRFMELYSAEMDASGR